MSSGHIVVTGGAGFIGSHLVERLLVDGKEVVVIDDLSTGSMENLKAVVAHPKLRVIQSKVSDSAELPALFAGAEAIYHLAAAVGVDLVMRSTVRTIQTNVHETEAVLEAAAQHRVLVLLASTSEVYGKSSKETFSEEDDLIIGPPSVQRWSYACSKLLDEFLALAYAKERGLPVIIARIFNTVGPRQTGRYGMVLPRFIEAAKTGKPLEVFGDGSQTRCFCWVGDTVEALVRLQRCQGAVGQVFNVGSDEEVSVAELAKLVIQTLKSQSGIKTLPYADAYPPGFEDMARRRPRLAKLEAAINSMGRIPLPEIVRRVAGWFGSEDWAAKANGVRVDAV